MKFYMILMLALMLGANYYVLLRLWQMMPTGVGRYILLGVGILVVCSFFGYFLISNILPTGAVSVIYKIGTSWFFVMLYLLVIFFIADIARLAGASHLLDPFMKQNLVTFGVLAAVFAVVFTAGYFNYRNKLRVEIDIPVAKELGEIGRLKIVAVSDLHLGYGIGSDELADWVKLINAENADLVIIAGDLIDSSVKPLYSGDMTPLLNSIKSRYGVYMALGNHEYISGLDKSLKFISGTDIKLLRDSTSLVDDLIYIVGRDDKTNPKRKTLAELAAGLDSSKPMIVIDHQPYHLEEAEAAGASLQISGHTHRGQIWPLSLITDAMYEDSYGLINKGATKVYVSSGLGIWGGKFRIGTRSEYVVINLTSSK